MGQKIPPTEAGLWLNAEKLVQPTGVTLKRSSYAIYTKKFTI